VEPAPLYTPHIHRAACRPAGPFGAASPDQFVCFSLCSKFYRILRSFSTENIAIPAAARTMLPKHGHVSPYNALTARQP